MKKRVTNSPKTAENRRSGYSGIFEMTTKAEKRAILHSRAKDLARESECREEAGECLDVLVFLLTHETYAIETRSIREVHPLIELTPLPCTPNYIFGIINIRGQILTILDMKTFFNLPEKGITNLNRVIVVWKENVALGILADEISEIRSIPEKNLHPPLPTMTDIHARYLKGITGEGLIILDIKKILSDTQLIVHEEVGESVSRHQLP